MLYNTGIYCIENVLDNKKYYGQAINIKNRTNKHISLLKHNKHFNKHLQNAWNKYGQDNFNIKTVCYCDKKDLNMYEQLFLDTVFINVNNNIGYNKLPIANSGRYKQISLEAREKISQSLKIYYKTHKHPNTGHITSDTTKNKIRNARIGTKLSTTTKEKIAKASANRIWSIESRNKASKTRTGTHPTQETLEKMSVANLGKKLSTVTKLKISQSKTGKKLTDITKQKISLAKKGNTIWLGKKHSMASREKMCKVQQDRLNLQTEKIEQIKKIRRLYNDGITIKALMDIFNMNYNTLYSIVNKITWKNI